MRIKIFAALALVSQALYCSEADAIIANILSQKSGVAPAQIAAAGDAFEKPAPILEANATVIIPQFVLKAIFDGKALINDKWLKIGDSVNDYKIAKIEKNRVILISGKKQKILNLFKGIR